MSPISLPLEFAELFVVNFFSNSQIKNFKIAELVWSYLTSGETSSCTHVHAVFTGMCSYRRSHVSVFICYAVIVMDTAEFSLGLMWSSLFDRDYCVRYKLSV